MSNNFFNFTLPEFQKKYGSDWTSFKTIIDSEIDTLFQKTWSLYEINDINKMSARVVQYWLDLYKIPYDDTDSVLTKKLRLRSFVAKQRNKAMEDIYLDIGESVVGLRGELFAGTDVGVWRWGHNRWAGDIDVELMKWDTVAGRWSAWRWYSTRTARLATYLRWSQDNPQFVVYFYVKTLDSDKLDQIVSILRDKNLKPAFYKIYLCDESFNILRTI